MAIDNIKHTTVKPSPLHGHGLFATHLIAKDTLLCILEGQVLTTQEYKALLASDDHDLVYFMEKYKIDETHIAAIPFRTKYSYINHNSVANVYSILKGRKLYVYALTEIEVGAELVDTYDIKKHIDVLGGFKNIVIA